MLTKLITGDKDYGPLQEDQIINEMTNLIFAGTDTTSNTLSYMLYEMAKNPVWQDKLYQELDATEFDDVPDYRVAKSLPVLDAIVHETLRVHPAAPASLQRVTPEKGKAIDGVMVPGNVRPPF